jgi:hypothetical protein
MFGARTFQRHPDTPIKRPSPGTIGQSRAVSSPSCASAFLLADPCEHGIAAISDVAPQANVWDQTRSGVLAHPTLRYGEHLGNLGRGQETVVHRAIPDGFGTSWRYKGRARIAQTA